MRIPGMAWLVVIAFVALGPLAAGAQSTEKWVAGVSAPPTPLRIHVNMNLVLPGPADASEAANKQREDVRKMIYESAVRECRVVEQSIAKTCRLESVSVSINANRPHSPGQVESVTVNGSFAMQVTLK